MLVLAMLVLSLIIFLKQIQISVVYFSLLCFRRYNTILRH